LELGTSSTTTSTTCLGWTSGRFTETQHLTNYIALYKKFPQYKQERSKRKSVSKDSGVAKSIKGEIIYTTGWTMP